VRIGLLNLPTFGLDRTRYRSRVAGCPSLEYCVLIDTDSSIGVGGDAPSFSAILTFMLFHTLSFSVSWV
jgi:hypothetical protein